MEDSKKGKSWLLTNVPDDIQKLIKEQQDKKKTECGCRYGVGQAIYNLLRKAYVNKDFSSLQNAKN